MIKLFANDVYFLSERYYGICWHFNELSTVTLLHYLIGATRGRYKGLLAFK